jgi:hypothetical protein
LNKKPANGVGRSDVTWRAEIMQCLHPDGRELVTITIDADNGNTTIRAAIHLRGDRVGLDQVVLLLICGVRVDVWAARGLHARFSPGKDRAAFHRRFIPSV